MNRDIRWMELSILAAIDSNSCVPFFVITVKGIEKAFYFSGRMNGGAKDPNIWISSYYLRLHRLINLLFSSQHRKKYLNLLYNDSSYKSHRPDTIIRLESFKEVWNKKKTLLSPFNGDLWFSRGDLLAEANERKIVEDDLFLVFATSLKAANWFLHFILISIIFRLNNIVLR